MPILRASPSGEFFYGEVGQVLVCTGAANWVAQSAAGLAVPLSNVFYVDINTETETADQNGSQEAPYSTITAALTDHQPPFTGNNGLTLIITPGDYTAEDPLELRQSSYVFLNAAGHWQYPSDQNNIGNLDNFVALPQLALAAGSGFSNCNLQGCTLTDGADFNSSGLIQVFGGGIAGAFDIGAMNAFDTTSEPGTILESQSAVNFDRCTLNATTIEVSTESTVNLINCCLVAPITVEFTGAASTLNLDSRTNYFWNLITGTLTNGSKVVQSDIA